jgi:uncharacterized protein YhaN
MRLRRLDLTRYGRFTNHALDFGERGDGPDLHVVYGPNEAGKSTALSAFLDLLYGIEMRSPYNFLHPYDTMRIGAALERGGAVSAWERVKANRNSLRDGHGQPVGDHALAAMLGGIDRDAYRSMFSLDDDTLERGGEDILRSQGDLGSLLFGASAGLSDLAERLQSLEIEAERFHKGRARSTELADLKRVLDEVDRERKAIDVQASTHARLTRDRDQAERAYDEAATALGAAKARAEEIARLRRGLELRAKLLGLRAELEGFIDLPDPPPHWHDEIGPLRDQETGLTRERDGLDRQIVEFRRKLDEIVVDEAILAVSERVNRLRESQGHYIKTRESLPNRRAERRDHDARIAVLVTQLERPADTDPRGLVLPASTVGTLRGLISRRSGVAEKLDGARTGHDRAAARVGAAQEALHRVLGGSAEAQPDPDPTPWRVLEATVQDLRRDGSEAETVVETRARDGVAEALADALAALAPWTGDAGALAGLAVPDREQVEEWKRDLAEVDADLEKRVADVVRLEADVARLTAERDAVGRTTGVVDDDTAAARRAARDAAWAEHKAALDPATADAFERAMRADDAATDSRLTRTTEVARLRQCAIDLATTEQALTLAREHRDAGQARRGEIRRKIAAALEAMGLPPDWSPGSLADWLTRRAEALRIHADLRARDRRLRELQDDARCARDRLVAAMAAVGGPPPPEQPLATLLYTADGVLKRHAEQSMRLESAREVLKEAEREVAERTQELNRAIAAEADWRSDWEAALAGCWLGADGARPTTEAVGAILEGLDNLKAVLDRRDDTDHRIAQMERDQHAHIQALSDVLADLGETLDPTRPVEVTDAVFKRFVEAGHAVEKHIDRSADLENALAARAALDAPLAALAARKAEMTALFGVETLTESASALKRVERRDALREQVRIIEETLAQTLGVPDASAAEARLADVDPEVLASEAAALESRLSDLETRRLEAFGALTTARNALAAVDAEDDVARLEARRRTLLLEIEDKARRHLSLRLGIAAARRALSLYQEHHRSSMLARAAEAFATISRGAYAGLSMQVEPDGEKLVALEAGGASKPVSALSKGTRFQLYLALRVAGYHEFASRHAAVPFVADDIMETFDDFRAEEAFRLFAGMAGVGQVIYLTHHRHLCEIARAVCPGVRIHTLDGPTPE